MEMGSGLTIAVSSLLLPGDEFPAVIFLTKYLLGPYCMSDMALGFEDTNVSNAYPAAERR